MAGTCDNGERTPLLGWTPLKGHRVASVAVLVVEGLEQAAFFGIMANLKFYLSSSAFGWEDTQASHACFFFLAASYLLSPVGGWLADVYLGAYGTVLLSFAIYLVVACLLPVTAWPDGRLSVCGQLPGDAVHNFSGRGGGTSPQQYCAPTIYTSLVVLALGVSSLRANLTSFGADQVKDQGRATTRRFFNWFYWSVNIGAAFSLLLVAFVQQNLSFLAGSLTPVACLALALILFLLATPTFATKPPTGSQVSAMLKLAMKSWGCVQLVDTRTRLNPRWWDPQPNGGAQPGAPSPQEDLANFQVLARLLPVMLTFIPYWLVNFQLQATYYLQGLHLHVPNVFQRDQDHVNALQGYTLPEAWLLLPNVVVLLPLVPLKAHLIDPFLARWRLVPSALKQVALGTFFSLASILAAGIVEQERLRYVCHNQTAPQLVGNDRYLAATLPVWWQVPQFLLMGISQLFVIIPGLEFTYTEAPESMKGATMGIFFFFSGMGLLLGSGLVALLSMPVRGWMRCLEDYGNVTGCRMGNYFFLLAGIQLVTCLLFTWISRCYRSWSPQLGDPHLCAGLEEETR